MWLLLVAAGSGYLAKCWHRTLQPKQRQLTDFAHVDARAGGEERAGGGSTPQPPRPPPLLLEDASSNGLPRNVSAAGGEVESKASKRTFSPKALGKKLFSSSSASESGKSGKAAKSRAVDESGRAISSTAAEKLSFSRWSPRSSFKSRKSPSADVVSEEPPSSESPGCFPTGESFRKRRERRRFDAGSSSSRSLQRYLGESELGSSWRESDAGDSSTRSFSSASAEIVAEIGDGGACEKSQEVVATAVDTGPEPPASGLMKSHGSTTLTGDNGPAAVVDCSPGVAEVLNRMEKGKREAGPAANAAGPISRVGALDGDGEAFPGGKGKRRAVARKAAADGSGEALSAVLLSGKRSKDSSDPSKPLPRESGGGVTVTSITCKRVKDAPKSKDLSGESGEVSPSSSALGVVDLSQVFFGFDRAFFRSPEDGKSPYKHYKRTRYLSRSGYKGTMRKMRESPRPVSALESCLRAQFPQKDERSGVARSLNFSTSMGRSSQRRDSLEPGAEMLPPDCESSSSPRLLMDRPGADESDQTEVVLGLPELKSPSPKRPGAHSGGQLYSAGQQLREVESNFPRRTVLEDRGRVIHAEAKVTDVLWKPTKLPVPLKKRKVSQACVPPAVTSANVGAQGYEVEALVIPPMEGLLFSFGVGIGVMSLINGPDGEFQRLSEELQKSEEKIENLNNLLMQARDSSVQTSEQLLEQAMVAGVLATEGVLEGDRKDGQMSSTLVCSSVGTGSGTEVLEIYAKEAPETPQQIEHMAELEAELEAELDALTSGITDGSSEAPDYEELDPDGVAGVADRDIGVDGLPSLLDWDDDNDDFIANEPAHACGGVPPRELSRLLRKVQSSRQELLIAELEAELNEKANKLQLMEKEVQQLKGKTASDGTTSAGVQTENATSASVTPSKDLGRGHGGLLNAYIEKLNQTDFRDTVHPSEEEIRQNHDEVPGDTLEAKKSRARLNSDSVAELKVRSKESAQSSHGSGILESVSSCPESILNETVESEPTFYLRRSISGEMGPKTGEPGPSKLSSSARATGAGSTSTAKARESKAQADNDAVCDEFLSSVFGSPDNQRRGNGSVTHALESDLALPFSLDQDSGTAESNAVRDSMPRLAGSKSVGDDLDKVVGQLLKRDSSSVKNALNAFLQMEAEDDELPSKDDAVEDRTVSHHRRRPTAGKNPTPQTTSYSSSPQKIALLPVNLGQLRSSLVGEKMWSVDKAGRIKKLQTASSESDDRSPRTGEDNGLEVFQPSSPNVADRSIRLYGQKRELHFFRSDQSPRSSKREAETFEVSPKGTLRDSFRTEAPVFGTAEVDFHSVLDARRELRYSSSKVQLFKSGSCQRRPGDAADAMPDVYRQREDGRRAGTTSPTGRPPARFQKRLYKTPTSDWLAEASSPPDA